MVAHVALLVRQERRANKLRAQLAAEVAEAVQRCPSETYTVGCHIAMQRDLDEIWGRYYGRWPGDEQALWLGVILANSRDAYATGVKLARDLITRHLQRFDPELLAALKERAQDGEL